MKTIFAVIGFSVVCLWGYHFYNSSPVAKKTTKVASDMAWNATAPYLNDAVNKATTKTK
jgi:hypothetical protein